MTHVFKHPKFYRIPRDKEEARAQLKVPSSNSDQVISRGDATAAGRRAPDPGHKLQAASTKPQAPSSEGSSENLRSSKRQASSTKSIKQQATSFKPQA